FCFPRDLHSFPTRRSSDLHLCEGWMGPTPVLVINRYREDQDLRRVLRATGLEPAVVLPALDPPGQGQLPAGRMQSALKRLSIQRDRKSTRLNSSHVKISYA